MEFTFFDFANAAIFVRDDAESAEWNQEDMTLRLLFVYKADKVVQRGQRVGFFDQSGVFQPFEIRKVKTYEPDHYQEITAEHIAISELTDEFFSGHNYDDVTAGTALAGILTGTLWSVGTNTASNTSGIHFGMADVWTDVRAIEKNWNVIITPRVIFTGGTITSRYLDIRPADGSYNGLRLSLDKNVEEAGVIWDDSEVKTALYGYGKSVEVTEGGEKVNKPLTFKEVVWTATSDHPAKPSGQEYLEDPVATAAYGRNGRPRFGFYQNSEIDDAEKLLEMTWESLKTLNYARVTIDCTVSDLYALGYVDVPLALHDMALVEIRPTGAVITQQICNLTIDLLDPTKTRVTIGDYIPNIVYIAAETNDKATGGGGGGGKSKTNLENEILEFETEIKANTEQIKLRAFQRDMDNVNEILRQCGITIDVATGVIVYADDNVNMWQSKLNVQADRISLVVQGSGANASIKAAQIILAINDEGSHTLISANQIDLDAIETHIAGYLAANNVDIGYLEVLNSLSVLGASEFTTINCGSLSADGGIDCDTLEVDGQGATWKTATYTTYSFGQAHYFMYTSTAGGTTPAGTVNGSIVTGSSNHTIYYLGHD